MAAVTSVNLSGDVYVDGLLGKIKWAVNAFTFSFPTDASFYGTSYGDGETSTNFGGLNTTQQAAVRTALSMCGTVANLAFTEVTETLTRHADLRFAMSDLPETAWAYFPSTSAEGGDGWFNKSGGAYNSPVKGNYAYLTFIHEIGHALGLEHPHESGMPADRDSMEYTVMSYRSYLGASTSTGYLNETWGFAQSLMMYDIATLQHLYGANYTINSASTVYSWSPTTGEMFINGIGQGKPGGNKILLTVWDGGGNDTYDFSNYGANLKVDLRPGNWTTASTTQLSKLRYDGSKLAAGTIANALLYKGDTRSLIENVIGGTGADTVVGNQAANTIKGNAGNDNITGAQGNDLLDGGAGIDTIVFSSQRSDYRVTLRADGSLEVVDLRTGSADGTDIVWNMETFQFTDRVYDISELRVNSSSEIFNITDLPNPPPNNLTVSGTGSSNTLYGGAGHDSLHGGSGNDVLIGGVGSDYLSGGSGIDYASYANAATGVVASLASPSSNKGDAAGDRYSSIEGLVGGAYADKLIGNRGANTIKGGAGDDRLYGRSGNDVLSGGTGNDVLSGSSGKDVMYGGRGADIFVFTAISHSRGSSIDTIKDFERGSDHIDLRSIDASTKAGGNQAFSFIGRSAFSGKAGQLKFANGTLSGDVNGDEVADFQVKVAGLLTLGKGDFYL